MVELKIMSAPQYTDEKTARLRGIESRLPILPITGAQDMGLAQAMWAPGLAAFIGVSKQHIGLNSYYHQPGNNYRGTVSSS